MKIFDKQGTWSRKVNFIDENNVCVGYSLTQACCETADWCICDEPFTAESLTREGLEAEEQGRDPTEDDWSGWTFDISFFEEFTAEEVLQAGIMAVFRIVKGEEEKYLHLYNSHNGYYSHGFEMSEGGTVLREGSL